MAAKTLIKATKTSGAIEILHAQIEGDGATQALLNTARLNAKVTQLIYGARTKAGLTQAQLADRIGTRQPVIARLEDADYEGHSSSMLQRIAAALNQRLDIRFMQQVKKAS